MLRNVFSLNFCARVNIHQYEKIMLHASYIQASKTLLWHPTAADQHETLTKTIDEK